MTNRHFDWTGVFTAIATPMTDDGVDETALRSFAAWQVNEGINGLVACGSTGEHATLTDDERVRVTQICLEAANGKVPVVMGVGTNDTRRAVAEAKHAVHAGADAILVVSPYYNKPTQEGLFLHFKAVAEAVPETPIILYNIPGRTAVNIEPATIARLASLPNIVAVKQATGEADTTAKLREMAPDLKILSGDDPLFYPILKNGGHGVISVTSNVHPKKMLEIYGAHVAGDAPKAQKAHESLADLFKALFYETNPIPVKAALQMMGKMKPVIRLPLTWITKPNGDKLAGVLQNYGLIGRNA